MPTWLEGFYSNINLNIVRLKGTNLVDKSGNNIPLPEMTWSQFLALDPSSSTYNKVVFRVTDKHATLSDSGGVLIMGDSVNQKWGLVSPQVVVTNFSDLPAASAVPGFIFYIKALGGRFISKLHAGSYIWTTAEEFTLINSSIPVILPPSQTVLTNGTINFNNATPNAVSFPFTFTRAWIYLPAGAISSGQEGLYYCEFSSGTLCQVYTEYVNPDNTDFTPYVPASKTAAVGSNSEFTTGTGTGKTLISKTIQANSFGTTGILDIDYSTMPMNGAATKTHQLTIGGSQIYAATSTSSANFNARFNWGGSGVNNVQFSTLSVNTATFYGSSSGNPVRTTLDMSTNQKVKVAPILSAATDYILVSKVRVRMEVPS